MNTAGSNLTANEHKQVLVILFGNTRHTYCCMGEDGLCSQPDILSKVATKGVPSAGEVSNSEFYLKSAAGESNCH